MAENEKSTVSEDTLRAEQSEVRQPNLNTKEGYWKTQGKRLKKHRHVLPFLLPAAIVSLIFSYIPMLGILFSFKEDFNLMAGDVIYNLTHGGWTLQHYADIFYDPSFLKAVGNTLIINVLKLAICFPLSILLALQLAELKNQGLAKVILIIVCIPNFLSWVIVIGIWQGVLHPDTGFLGKLFFQGSVEIMGEDSLFKFFVIILNVWKGVGWGSIIYYAAITSIDKSYYEAATIDGANKFQKAWYLTLPAILPTIALMLVMQFSGMMAAGFEQIYTMMQINPDLMDSQITLDTYLYDISVVNRTNIPFATALGVFNGLIALILMIVGNKITTKTLHRSLW